MKTLTSFANIFCVAFVSQHWKHIFGNIRRKERYKTIKQRSLLNFFIVELKLNNLHKKIFKITIVFLI